MYAYLLLFLLNFFMLIEICCCNLSWLSNVQIIDDLWLISIWFIYLFISWWPMINIYHQPTSSKYAQPISVFLDEFQTFLFSAATTPHEFIITRDFNIHLDDPLESSSEQFTDLLSSTNLTFYNNFIDFKQAFDSVWQQGLW